MSTIRQQLMALLKQKDWDARTLSQHLGVRERDIYSHLPHIRRSAEAAGKTFVVFGPECLQCGFRFAGGKKERDKTGKPSRCPICKSEHITAPRFMIQE